MEYKQAFGDLYKTAKDKFNIQQAPNLILRKDKKNAENMLGRTAHYNPEEKTIVIFIIDRHPKDILRSFCHEMVHHVQNERGDLKMSDTLNPKYAQEDGHMRDMEKEAYLEGNLLFRDWEDNVKYK